MFVGHLILVGMMAVDSFLLESAGPPTAYDSVFMILMFVARLWVGIIVGVLVGWIWKPKWVDSHKGLFISSQLKDNLPTSCFVGSISSLNSLNILPKCLNLTSNCGDEQEQQEEQEEQEEQEVVASISRFVA